VCRLPDDPAPLLQGLCGAPGDPEMAELAREEVAAQSQALDELSSRLKVLLLPRDPLDERNIMLEVRGVPHSVNWLLKTTVQYLSGCLLVRACGAARLRSGSL